MGKAARWFKGLFGMKKGKDGREDLSSNPVSGSGDGKKRKSNFGHSGREASPAAGNAWLRSYYTETEREQNKQAIAVAEATAAAAVSAVAAAQAAVAVVRMTRHGRGGGGGGGERLAAVRIQTVFRGFLARKALRALRGLVKIQALVRGFLVRKQAAATLNGMQAMARAQATVRLQKLRRQVSDDRSRARIGARKSLERFDDTRSEYLGSVHSRRLSDAVNAVDENPKIVEVDTGRPKSRSRRSNTNTSISDFGDYPFTQTLPSPNPHNRSSSRSPAPDRRSYHETEWFFSGEDCRFSEPQTTPRFSHPPATPPGDHFFRQQQYGYSPNYMSNTQSFNAKLRSCSAPKQRPEPKKRLSLSDMMEARSSLSGVRMQRSCSRAQEAIDFNNVVMKKLDEFNDFSRYSERYSVSGKLRTLYR